MTETPTPGAPVAAAGERPVPAASLLCLRLGTCAASLAMVTAASALRGAGLLDGFSFALTISALAVWPALPVGGRTPVALIPVRVLVIAYVALAGSPIVHASGARSDTAVQLLTVSHMVLAVVVALVTGPRPPDRVRLVAALGLPVLLGAAAFPGLDLMARLLAYLVLAVVAWVLLDIATSLHSDDLSARSVTARARIVLRVGGRQTAAVVVIIMLLAPLAAALLPRPRDPQASRRSSGGSGDADTGQAYSSTLDTAARGKPGNAVRHAGECARTGLLAGPDVLDLGWTGVDRPRHGHRHGRPERDRTSRRRRLARPR